MATTLYKEVNYTLKGLAEDIDLGEIALPELQRPFVWSKAKVRDLFDSMYRGFPVGFLLFWATSAVQEKTRQIGAGKKKKHPRLLVVDGQQRLTSLFAVVKGYEVINEEGLSERIQIAFCPSKEKFEVLDAAVKKDPEYIHDISELWSVQTGKSRYVKDFLEKLRLTREVSEKEEDKIADAIDKLYNLENFPFYALELFSSVDEEQVAEVFVRINSKGQPLNQADFILTIMSVFWEQGRKDLEKFCLQTRTPSDGAISAYNQIVRPGPDDLLRVIIGYGFNRGRLKYGYSILRGKDLDTGEISSERRDQQFSKLKKAQDDVLNLTDWHEFLKVPLTAGFLSENMISSQVGLLFSYSLYLVGLKDFNIDRATLRLAVAKWLFMGAITSRYTGSPESVIERDLVEFRNCKSSKSLLDYLDKVISSELTEDFWNISLVNELATSSAQSPSLYAYHAALCLLNAKALFSNLYLRDLFGPQQRGPRSNLERHHLFPKNYLKSIGVSGVRETNQIANYAWLEWSDNSTISDRSPSDYFNEITKRISASDKLKMNYWHALPANWYELDYSEFLVERRKLIAKVIRDGFGKISDE